MPLHTAPLAALVMGATSTTCTSPRRNRSMAPRWEEPARKGLNTEVGPMMGVDQRNISVSACIPAMEQTPYSAPIGSEGGNGSSSARVDVEDGSERSTAVDTARQAIGCKTQAWNGKMAQMKSHWCSEPCNYTHHATFIAAALLLSMSPGSSRTATALDWKGSAQLDDARAQWSIRLRQKAHQKNITQRY